MKPILCLIACLAFSGFLPAQSKRDQAPKKSEPPPTLAPHPESKPIVDVLPSKLDPNRTVETLKGMFVRAQDLYLEADTARGAIIIRGTAEQIAEIKAALVVLEQDVPGAGNVKIVTVERGGA